MKLGGSLTWETPGRVESRPANAGTCRYCQTVRVRQSETGRRTRETSGVKLLKRPTSSNLADTGWIAVRTVRRKPGGNSEPEQFLSVGGHGEGPRCSRGDAAGAELGADARRPVMW